MGTPVLTIIQEAGAKGITRGQISEKSKLEDNSLEAEIKCLRAEGQIAGPFKSRGERYYARNHAPNAESAGLRIEALIRSAGGKLWTKTQAEKGLNQPFKKFFLDGVRLLISKGKVAQVKGGRSLCLLHVDTARRLFPSLGESADTNATNHEGLPSKAEILNAYRQLKSEQGGLSAVSIGKLRNRLGCDLEVLHRFLLEEAHHQVADLHPSTSLDLSPEDREGALAVPGKHEPAITVTFRG